MDKIKEIEYLLGDWKAAKHAAVSFNHKSEKYYKGGVKALKEALEILKRPSNTQIHVDTKPCNKHGYYKTFTAYKFCPCCGRALSQ